PSPLSVDDYIDLIIEIGTSTRTGGKSGARRAVVCDLHLVSSNCIVARATPQTQNTRSGGQAVTRTRFKVTKPPRGRGHKPVAHLKAKVDRIVTGTPILKGKTAWRGRCSGTCEGGVETNP